MSSVASSRDGMAPVLVDVGDTRLAVWDTGGDGDAVVMLHAHSGNGALWFRQHSALAVAGFRGISYSRRGHHPSDAVGHDVPAADDLLALLDALDLAQVHLVGVAAGGAVAVDFLIGKDKTRALRVRTLALVSSLCGVTTGEFAATTRRLLPTTWRELPAAFQELGPSYRSTDPAGTEEWARYAAMDRPAKPQRTVHTGECAALASIAVPTLFVTGSADLYLPPPRQEVLAGFVTNSETAVLANAGHASYWEQPEAFNRLLLGFLERHR